MEFEINPERQQYLSSRGKIIVNACPGSGKTTSVAYKLQDLVSNWDHAYSGIACLSFTNVAKDEINDKFHSFTGKSLTHPHLVSTIDSFINQFITLPHYQKVLGYSNRPIIIEDYTWIDNLSLQRFKIGSKPIQYIYKPSKIDITYDGHFLYDGKSLNLNEEDHKIYLRYCMEIKRIQFQNGFLKSSDSIYAAYQILSTNPNIARYLSQRFPYIIIDEAQDTSELQHFLFDKLINNGLENIELIGDPYQSLYEWREARPDLFLEKASSGDWLPLNLLNCRRSVQPIVNAYSLFRMQEHNNLIGQESQLEQVIHIIYFENHDQLLEKYEDISASYTEKKILVRGTTLLESLKASAKTDDYWKETPFSPLHFIHSKSDLDNGDIKTAINRLVKIAPLLLDPTILGNEVLRNQVYEEIKQDYFFRSKLLLLLRNIPAYTLSLIDWTNQLKELCKNTLNLNEPPSFTLKAGSMRPFQRRTVSELFSQPLNSQKVTTIHKVKGKTFDSIMLVLSTNSSGQNLSINDFIRPTQIPNEKKRLLYVAMSRPKWQLVIGIPKTARLDETQKQQLFGDCQVHEL